MECEPVTMVTMSFLFRPCGNTTGATEEAKTTQKHTAFSRYEDITRHYPPTLH
jgi:hypothetical protein